MNVHSSSRQHRWNTSVALSLAVWAGCASSVSALPMIVSVDGDLTQRDIVGWFEDAQVIKVHWSEEMTDLDVRDTFLYTITDDADPLFFAIGTDATFSEDPAEFFSVWSGSIVYLFIESRFATLEYDRDYVLNFNGINYPQQIEFRIPSPGATGVPDGGATSWLVGISIVGLLGLRRHSKGA